LRRFTKRPDTFSDPDLDEYARAVQRARRRHGRDQLLTAPAGALVRGHRCEEDPRPTLLIWGEDDVALGIELTPRDGRATRASTARGISADTGHFVMESVPEVVNRLLLEFLA